LYRIGAAGLPPLPTVTQAISTPSPSCMGVGETLTPWSASTTPILVPNCNAAIVDDRLTTLMCGLYSRFDNTAVPDACVNLTGVDSTIFQTDTFIDDLADYSTEYQGNGRRVITVAVVDPALTVLGFRQFLLEPGLSFSNGRFSVLYVATTSEAGDRANLVPVRQGSIGGCQQVAGPGKVVLHQ
jgi:hypothetical protein